MNDTAPTKARAFTLIELLVVVAIIVVLLALLLPSMGRALALAEDVSCRSQLSQLGRGFFAMATDRFNIMPASSISGWEGVGSDQKCWLGSEVGLEPQQGPLTDYVGGVKPLLQILRCPSLVYDPANIGTGVGSNGLFDYSMSLTWGGAAMATIPATSHYVLDAPYDYYDRTGLPTPLLQDEDPMHHINSFAREPGFGSVDVMGSHHIDISGNYVAFDGSAQHLAFQPSGGVRPCGYGGNTVWNAPRNQEWYSRRPSGTEYRHYDCSYGWWNQQP